MPASSHRDTAAYHAVSRNSPSIELSQLQQRVVNFHLLPHPRFSNWQRCYSSLCVYA